MSLSITFALGFFMISHLKLKKCILSFYYELVFTLKIHIKIMNVFSASIKISLWHTMRWRLFPLFLFSRPVCKKWEIFVFEELLGLGCNVIWTYCSVFHSLFISYPCRKSFFVKSTSTFFMLLYIIHSILNF